MADNTDSVLEVLINTVLNATGYRMNEAEAQKLQETILKTSVVSTEASALDVAGTEKQILAKRELRHIIGALGAQEVPELSRALTSLAYGGGATAGIFLIAGAFEYVRRKVLDARDEVRKLTSQIAMDARDAAENSAQSWNAFVAKLNEAKDPADKIEAAYQRQKALLEDISKAHSTILEQMEKEELAQAKGDAAKESEVKERYDKSKMNYEVASGQAQIALHQQYLDQLNARQVDLNRAAEAVAKDVAYLKSIRPTPSGWDINPATESNLRATLEAAQSAAARAETDTLTPNERLQGKSLQDRREELATAEKQLDIYLKNREALNDYNAHIQRETDLLKANEDARDKNSDRITAESNALKIERDKSASQFAGDSINKAIELSRRAAAGGSLNPAESQFVQSVGSIAAGQNIGLKNAEQLLIAMQNNSKAIDFALGKVVQVMENTNSIVMQRLSDLEARMNRPIR